MASPVVTLELDTNDFQRLRRALPGKAEKAVAKKGALIERRAVLNAPFDTQDLINSSVLLLTGSGFNRQAEIAFRAKHAIFVHEGTGIFGPKGRPIEITPVNAQALFWPGAAHPVKRVVIKGMEPRPFLRDAFEEEQTAAPTLAELVF